MTADATTKLETGRSIFLSALDLLRDPQGFYERARTSLKKAMNKLVFTKLYVDDGMIWGHELAETVCGGGRAFYRRSEAVAGTYGSLNAMQPRPGGRGCMDGTDQC